MEHRCECGKLLIKQTRQGYELKCPRCKKLHILPYEQIIVDYLNRAAGDHESSAPTLLK